MDEKDIRNIGVLAHVDAGKTTLVEQILYKSGVISSLGSVDKGTAHTDNMEIEQQRGISIKSAEANLIWNNIEINLIDTPGHIDFSSEVERSLCILDGAILVISAVEGVQPQTEIYFKALKTMKIPTIIFINKIDRIGADIERVLNEIDNLLTDSGLSFSVFEPETQQYSDILYLLDDNLNYDTYKAEKENLIETLADKDDILLERYINGETIDLKLIKDRLKQLAYECRVYPIVYGAALRGLGIIELLDLLTLLIPSASKKHNGELSAIVYKIKRDKVLGKLAYLRLYEGQIQSRDIIYNFTKDTEEKITHIRKLQGQKEMDFNKAVAGDIVCVSGLRKVSIGDILGNPSGIPVAPKIATPLLTVQVFPKQDGDYIKLVEVLEELDEEDPLLNFQNIKERNELHIQIMGMIQIEILENILKSKFDLDVRFGNPSIIYKETPLKKGIGFEAYTMPKPCWAIVKFEIEPLPRGQGLIYESKVRTEDIKLRYQREIEAQLPKTLEQGLYGWEVTDLKVTLIEGEDHVMHSNPGDFHIATAMGIMNGLAEVGTALLEPIIAFRISVPEEVGGKVLNDIVQMRGGFDSPVIMNGTFTIEGEMPMATSVNYPAHLGIISSGKGIISTKFSGYRPIPLDLGAMRERVGVNPLDRAKYILFARNAIK